MKMMKLWMLVAVAAIASACQKQDEVGIEGTASNTVQFIATEDAGRTAFGEPVENIYPVLWQEEDLVTVSLNMYDRAPATVVTPVNNGKSASFAVAYDEEAAAAAAEKTFYAVVPNTGVSGYYNNGNSDPRFIIKLLADQTPLANSCDPKVQILYAQSATYTTIPEQVEMSFKHWCAYGCMTIKNLNTTEKIAKVQLTVDSYLAGSTYWRPTAANEVDRLYNIGGSPAPKTPEKTITLNTSSVENPLWFAALPVDLSGKELSIRVVLENGDVIKKNITFKNGDGNFQAGRIAKFSVDFAGITVDNGFSVGDVYPKTGTPEGVVFWVADDGASAKIVSLTQIVDVWMKPATGETPYPNVGGLSGSTYTGIENTEAIKKDAAEKGYDIPMLTLLKELGSDWYWPTTSDLTEVYNAKSEVDNTLTTLGYRTFGNDLYWTSRQNSTGTKAYYVNFKSGSNTSMHDKNRATNYSRAVKIVR